MTKIKLIALTGLISMFICFQAAAQNMHNILIWGSGGFSALMSDVSDISSKGGLGAGVGAGYELHYKWFRLQTGGEFTFLNPALGINNFVHDQPLYDSEGDPYTAHYYFKENRDRYGLGNVNIPLMLGAQFGRVYFLVGGKVGLNLFGSSKVSSTITTTGEYPQFIDPFGNMPNHFFGTVEEVEKYPAELELNVSASAEIGFYLGESPFDKNPRYRLSFFCDYGLLNVHNNSISENLILNKAPEPYYQPVLNSFMLSEPMTDSFVNTLYAGVKFTIEFGLTKKDCLCEPYLKTKPINTNHSRMSTRGQSKSVNTRKAKLQR